ncbi:unnamed protein product [Arctogadus glacialis]
MLQNAAVIHMPARQRNRGCERNRWGSLIKVTLGPLPHPTSSANHSGPDVSPGTINTQVTAVQSNPMQRQSDFPSTLRVDQCGLGGHSGAEIGPPTVE